MDEHPWVEHECRMAPHTPPCGAFQRSRNSSQGHNSVALRGRAAGCLVAEASATRQRFGGIPVPRGHHDNVSIVNECLTQVVVVRWLDRGLGRFGHTRPGFAGGRLWRPGDWRGRLSCLGCCAQSSGIGWILYGCANLLYQRYCEQYCGLARVYSGAYGVARW